MMKIPAQQMMFYVEMIDFGFVWSLYFISLDLQQMEEIKNIYIYVFGGSIPFGPGIVPFEFEERKGKGRVRVVRTGPMIMRRDGRKMSSFYNN